MNSQYLTPEQQQTIYDLLKEGKTTRLDIALAANCSLTTVYNEVVKHGFPVREKRQLVPEKDTSQPTNWLERADELEARYGHVMGYHRLMCEWTPDPQWDHRHRSHGLEIRRKVTDGRVRRKA
jgi:hypothetical protein